MKTIPCGQSVRFEQVKYKICKEVDDLQLRLKYIMLESLGKIVDETSNMKRKTDGLILSVEEELKWYINKTDELESYLLNRGNLIHSVSNYIIKAESILYKLEELKHTKWNMEDRDIIRYNSPFGEGYVEALKKFKGKLDAFLFQKIYGLESLRGRIEKLKIFLNEVLYLDQMGVTKEKNSSFDFQTGDCRYDKALTQIRGSILEPVEIAGKIHELLGKTRLLRAFERLFKEIGVLKTSMNPIRNYIIPGVESFVDNLEYTVTTKEDIVAFLKGMENGIHKTIGKLHNAQKIIKFLQATKRTITQPLSADRMVCFDRIEEHISKLKDWIVTAKAAFRIVNSSFRENIGQLVQIDRHDDIRSGPVQIKEYITCGTKRLIEHIKQKITLLKSIQSIHKELEEIKKISKEHDKAIKEAMSSCGLDTTSLEKIKKAIDGFVEIRKNIDNIEKCFCEKQKELDHIKGNVKELKSLKPYLTMLNVSIKSDIVFAKIIEKIRSVFESLKMEAQKEFEKVGFMIVYLIRNIKSIIETLGSICCIRESICCKKSGLTDLKNLKIIINELKSYLERLSEYINDTNELLVGLNGSILILQKYMRNILSIRYRIMVLALKTMNLRIIEHFPDLLFMTLGLGYMIKCHQFFNKIQEYIKSALDTLEHLRLFLRIIIFENKLAGFWVTWVIGEIKTKSDVVRNNITEVELSTIP